MEKYGSRKIRYIIFHKDENHIGNKGISYLVQYDWNILKTLSLSKKLTIKIKSE